MEYTFEDRKGGSNHVDPGDYTLKIVGAEGGYSSKGNAMIKLKLAVNADVNVFSQLVMTEKALWFVDRFLVATGLAPAKGAKIDMNEAWIKGLLGRTVRATLGLKDVEKDGKVYQNNEVLTWLDPAQPAAKRNDNPF